MSLYSNFAVFIIHSRYNNETADLVSIAQKKKTIIIKFFHFNFLKKKKKDTSIIH